MHSSGISQVHLDGRHLDLYPDDGDVSLARQVQLLLEDCGYQPLRALECRVRQGVVELSGTVSSFYMKQMAQVVVQRAAIASEVRNLVQVA